MGIFVQVQAGYLIELQKDGEMNDDRRATIVAYFGSVGHAMLSLFQATTGGIDWRELYEMLRHEGVTSCFTLLLFVAFWHFSMLNIVTGLVMEKAVRNATPDRDQLMLEQRRAEDIMVAELKKLFMAMDSNGDSMLCMDEFVENLKDERIRQYLASLGISIQDAKMFFQVLMNASGNSSLHIDDFVMHCSHMKGYAMAIDLSQLTFQVGSMRRELHGVAMNKSVGYA